MAGTRITETEFDGIKQNLIDFFKGQDYWKDYEFEASGLNLLMDLLAYSTHYETFYGNSQFAESFIDSAKRRESVVSLASELSYLPRSIKASKILMDITIRQRSGGPALPSQLILPKGTKFSGSTSSNSQNTFITTNAYTSVQQDDGSHKIFDVEIYQGSYSSHSFYVNKNDKWQKFILPSDKIDIDFLEVYVQEGSDDMELVKYNRVSNLLDVDENSRIYFLNEAIDGRYQIHFGDGVLGRAVKHGKIIRVVYLVTNGIDGNGTKNIVLGNSDLFSDYDVEININAPAAGGAERESVESIKFNAPKHFVTRDRAVSRSDWENIIREKFTGIKSVKVWGGENEDIPFGQFGRAYIAINPDDNTVMTEARKKEIVDELRRKYGVILTTPIIVDPDVLYLKPTINVFVNILDLKTDEDSLKSKVVNTVSEYSDEALERFEYNFEPLTLASRIWNIDTGVITNTTIKVILEHRIVPEIQQRRSYAFDMRNGIVEGTVASNEIQWDFRKVYLQDVNGVLQLYEIVDGNKIVVNNDIGTVDYSTGRFEIRSIYIQKVNKKTFDWRISAQPRNEIIITEKNKILKIDKDSVSVDVTASPNSERRGI
jgi:hypothetical protein